MRYKKYHILLVLTLLSIALVFTPLESPFFLNGADAKVTGSCANCHTMHASQNGSSGGIAFGGSSLPQPALLRGDCLGCHGMGTANKIVTIGGSEIPQVLHTDPSGDLAGGNFAYITGAKSRVTADGNSAGHNVIDLGVGYKESVLQYAPGVFIIGHSTVITKDRITCAGYVGCHGRRINEGGKTGIPMLKGAHHNNVDGICNTNPATAVAANSYRFLVGVKGLEITGTYKYQNYNANNHNEYFGQTAPLELNWDCTATSCHTGGMSGPAYSPNGSISVFCGTCHGLFHDKSEMGGGSSPFTRHPTDVTLPNSGEYTAYTAYSTEAPVARTTVPGSISPIVTPSGNTDDIVMCLSCHGAHATPYADILKWDYTTMIAGGGGSGGCFTCHTQKKNAP